MEENKVLEFPDAADIPTPDAELVDAVDLPDDAKSNAFKMNPDDPFNATSEKELGKLLGQVRDMLGIMQQQWENSQKDYDLTEPQMQSLYKYNEDHRTPPPEGVDEYDEDKYDRFNGFANITHEEVVEIFGEGHKIIGVTHDVTLDRIKVITGDFLSWLIALREYTNIHNAYMELIEFKEEEEMKLLQQKVEEADTPENKEKMQAALDQYFYNKYLGFIGEPLSDEDRNRIIKAWHSQPTIGYWIDKARGKFKQLKISDKFILAVSSFEKRFMDEKYHAQDNIFLLYFLSQIAWADTSPKSMERARVICMIVAMDRLVRNRWSEEIKTKIMENIEKLEDQFLGRMHE